MPKTFYFICGFFGLAVATGAFAQSKTDGQWRGSGGAALSATSGNTTTSSLQLNADGARATATDKVSLYGLVNYSRATVAGTPQTTSNKWALGGQYDRNLSQRLFAFGKLGLESDKLLQLSHRASMAGGLGYKVIDTAGLAFNLYGGLGYTSDKYSVVQTIGGKTDTGFSRVSLYLAEESTHRFSSTTSFRQRLDLYPGLTGDKAFLAKFNAGLSVAMSSTLSLSVGLTDTYNSKPPAGLKASDLGLFTGINVKFGAAP